MSNTIVPQVITNERVYEVATVGDVMRRRTVHTHGINDVEFMTLITVNGKVVKCPIYSMWQELLRRCYSVDLIGKDPRYGNTTIDPNWHSFSVFRTWMLKQNWEGREIICNLLDMDNKHFSPDTTMFIPGSLRRAIVLRARAPGAYPVGVHWDKRNMVFSAQVQTGTRTQSLGTYKSPRDAHLAYLVGKQDVLLRLARKYHGVYRGGILLRVAKLVKVEARLRHPELLARLTA